MAFLKLGLTRSEITDRLQQDLLDELPPTEILGRYGANPQRFFDPNDVPRYSDLTAPEFLDADEREYSRVNLSDPRSLYVRLPVSITRKQHRANQIFGPRQEFPHPGDKITVRKRTPGSGGDDGDNEDNSYTVVGVAVASGHVATALVKLDRDLPPREDVDADERVQRRIQKRVDTVKRHFHVKEGETELSNETREVMAGHPRQSLVIRHQRRHSVATSKTPRAMTTKMAAAKARSTAKK
jgi:hypothetical protein